MGFENGNEPQSEESTSIPIFVYNLDKTSHEVFIQISGTSQEEASTNPIRVSPKTIDKATEVGTDDFYIKARVEELQNGMDATGPARGESDFSEDGYLIVIYEETQERSRVEIKPLNPGETGTATD
jgi:hypothetical protein